MNISKSLEEVNGTVDTRKHQKRAKKLFAFLGPAYLVSVGYMDPGNWATDIAGGSKFGYTLIWVLVMSNLIALLLQSLSARLGVVRNLDLAQASRQMYPKWVNICNWVLAEIAIAACDLAEVIGMAIGLNLLFGLDMIIGVSISVLDTLIITYLLQLGIRKIEAFILTLVFIIGVSFFIQMLLSQPSVGGIVSGLIPSIPDDTALYIAIGIIGATVMPHNLYLHSSLVQTRIVDRDENGIKKALRYNLFDTTIALNLALFVNAAILILAASTFFKNGYNNVEEIQDAHKLLEPLLGTSLAPVLFAVALIAAGQSSTITGTLAGQVIMEGYLNLKLKPWARRLITRSIAIIPAYFTIIIFGEDATGELLVLSQVILSMQLGFAIIPLIHAVSDKELMGVFTIKKVVKLFAWISALIIVGLNIKLVYETVISFATQSSIAIATLIYAICFLFFLLLMYIVFSPIIKRKK